MKPNLPKRVKEKNKINSLALDLLQACVCWDPNSHFHNFVESLVTFYFPSWTENFDKWGPSTCHNRVTLFRSGPHFLSLAGFLKSINSSRSTRHSPAPPLLSSPPKLPLRIFLVSGQNLPDIEKRASATDVGASEISSRYIFYSGAFGFKIDWEFLDFRMFCRT